MTLVEVVVVCSIVVAGVVAVAAYWKGSVMGAVLLGAPIGVALYAIGGLFVYAAGIFSTGFATAAMALLAAAAHLAKPFGVRGMELPRLARAIALALIGATGVLVLTSLTSLTRLTPDSIDHLYLAGSLERFGTIPDVHPDELLKRQFVVGALQAPGVLSGRGYFASIITMAVASGAGLMLWLGWHALEAGGVERRRAIMAVVTVGLFVISTNRVLYHHFYINGHGLFASLLLIVVGLLWYATRTGHWSVAAIAGLAAGALVPLRAEAILVLVFFLLVPLVSRSTPTRARWSIVAPIVVVSAIWNGWILRDILPSSEFTVTSAPVMALVVAVGLASVAALPSLPGIARVARFVPAVAFTLLLAYTAARVLRGSSLFSATMEAMGANLASAGLWGTFWWLAPLAIVVCIAVVRVPFQDRLLWGLAAYPIILLAAAYLRGSAYRVGPGDSANRMLMHVVFVIGLYLIVAVGEAARQVPDSEFSIKAASKRFTDALTID